MRIHFINFWLLMVLFASNIQAQDSISYISLPAFAGGSPNVIEDGSKSMHAVFEQLLRVRSACSYPYCDSTSLVSIVHIGDSHIQADYLTGTTRRLMQYQFGNAGRGLVAPLRMTKTNGGRSYRITSNQQWNYNRLIKPGNIPIGIAGIGLQIQDTLAQVNIRTIDDTFFGEWGFNRVTAFFDNNKANVSLIDRNLLLSSVNIGAYAQRLDLKYNVSDLTLDFSSPVDNQISFFGLELSNRRSGVLYSAIGINGAQFSNYANENLLCEQISYLRPRLIIISLGTNEAFGRVVNTNAVNAAISDAVFQLRKFSPDAVILLTTPPEHLKRYARNKKGPNANVQELRDIIVRYARKNACPYWDLYSITGGKLSANQWKKKGYLTKDGIHFTQAGYEYQGELLFQALSKSYNDYLKQRNKHGH